MSAVKIITNSMGKAQKAQNHADIKGQGTIPYAKTIKEKTPNIEKATVTMGKKRGMGAALRGNRFKNC